MWTYSKKRLPGFTLVELAIVLVIIGLILAAVFKGQEMIQNAKAKNVINDLKGVSAAYYSYQDRYKAIPGDDSAATNHLGQTAYNGDGNGVIAGSYTDNNATVTTESQAFWQHARMAGFLTGTVTSTTAPAGSNAMGGLLGVQDGTATAVYGMVGPVVCAGSIPWKIAQVVDLMIDDGNSDTGNVRSGAASATPNNATAAATSLVYGTGAAAPAYPDELHTLCMKI